MIRFLADENFNNRVVRGVRRRLPTADIVRVQDVGLDGHPDAGVLAWAAGAGRIVLSHDLKTFPSFAYDRVGSGLPMPGVFLVDKTLPIGLVVNDLVTAVITSDMEDWDGVVEYLPF